MNSVFSLANQIVGLKRQNVEIIIQCVCFNKMKQFLLIMKELDFLLDFLKIELLIFDLKTSQNVNHQLIKFNKA